MAKTPKDVTPEKKGLVENIVQFVTKNAKLIGAGFIIFVLIGGAIVGMNKMSESKALKNEAQLYKYRSKLENFFQAYNEGKADKKPTFDKIQPSINEYKSEILKQSSTVPALISGINLAGLYTEYDKFDEAEGLLGKLKSSGASGAPMIATLISHQKATLLFEMKKYTEAISAFDQILNSKSNTYLHPDALLKKGLSQYKLNNSKEAMDTFEQVSDEYPENPIADLAKKYLRVIQHKSGKGSNWLVKIYFLESF